MLAAVRSVTRHVRIAYIIKDLHTVKCYNVIAGIITAHYRKSHILK
jgi:hypothetical protein